MLEIASSEIKVTLLDPVADRARLGSRYCAGGYIWQVTDSKLGPLFSGPKYPDPNPTPWDGQGLPEAFEIALNQHSAAVGEDVFVIGVGRVRRESPIKPFHVRDNFTVTEFSPWTIELSPNVSIMVSKQEFQNWSFTLTRRIAIEGRILTSTTLVQNQGPKELPLRWFAHPFFALPEGPSTKFSVDCDFIRYLPINEGFQFNSEGFIERNLKCSWTKGCFQLLNLPFGFPLHFIQRHPLLSEIKVECAFPVAWMPLWANDRTISPEPYLHTILKSDSELEWSMRYFL